MFSVLTRLYARTINLGISDESETDSALNRHIRQCNSNGLLFFLADQFVALLLWFVLDKPYLSAVFFVSGLLFLISSLGLNYLGFTRLSRLSTPFIGTVLIAVCNLSLGEAAYAQIALILGAVFPFVYFEPAERKEIILSVSFPIIAFLVITFEPYLHAGPMTRIGNQSDLILKILFFLTTFLGVFLNSFGYLRQTERSNETLKQSEKNLELLFKAMSHDIANPLTVVMNLTTRAEEGNPLTQNHWQMIRRNLSKISSIHLKLKQMSFVLTGKYPMQLKSENMAEVIQSALLSASDQAKAKQIELRLMPTILKTPLIALVDREILINQIVHNILSNAIKFSKAGSYIDIQIGQEVVPRDRAIISIRDYGIGMEAHQVENLFQWKKQTTKLGTSGEVGSGLGLPIAHQFIAIMGGEIKVESCPGRGTTFHLILST